MNTEALVKKALEEIKTSTEEAKPKALRQTIERIVSRWGWRDLVLAGKKSVINQKFIREFFERVASQEEKEEMLKAGYEE